MDVEFEEVEEWVGDEGNGAVYVWGLLVVRVACELGDSE